MSGYLVTRHRAESSRPFVVRRGPRGPIVARFARRSLADDYLRGLKRLLAINVGGPYRQVPHANRRPPPGG